MKPWKTIRNYALMKRGYENIYGRGTYFFSWGQIVLYSFIGWPRGGGKR